MSIKLKKAFQYQNLYREWIDRGEVLIKRYSAKRTENHLRSKALAEGVDEKIEHSILDEYEFSVNDVIAFVEHILHEKVQLTHEIDVAKRNCGFDIDGELALNKCKQTFASTLKSALQTRTNTVKDIGRDYVFDAEKKQGVYQYPIETVSSADFDKNVAAAIHKRLMLETDETSMKVDEIMITVDVNYNSDYTTDMSFEEAVEMYKKSKG